MVRSNSIRMLMLTATKDMVILSKTTSSVTSMMMLSKASSITLRTRKFIPMHIKMTTTTKKAKRMAAVLYKSRAVIINTTV